MVPPSAPRRLLVTLAVLALGLASVQVATSTPASAAAACPAGSTAVPSSSPLICQASITFTPPSGTWTVPAGVTSVDVVVIGGGGGGNSVSTGSAPGGGGGGGAEIKAQTVVVTPLSTVNVFVGGGGGGGVESSLTGRAGQSSTFGSVTARGGAEGGGTRSTGSSNGDGTFSGGLANSIIGGGGAGAGGAGASGASGGAGGAGLAPTYGLFAGNTTKYAGGGGGAASTGTGGSGTDGGGGGASPAASIPGMPGMVAGAGGGGGVGPLVGGPGANGAILIRFRQLPLAPTNLVATPQDGKASIAFTPSVDGTSAITNYEYSLDGTNWTPFNPSVTSGPVEIPGLTNGTSYSVRLRAVSALGEGSPATVSVVPGFVPGAPTGLVATADDTSVSIAFTPGAQGTLPIDNYQYSLNGGSSWTALSPDDTTSPVRITGLTNGTSYSIQLRAVSAVGPSLASSSVSVVPGFAPSAPTGLTAVGGNTSASIAFTSGAEGTRPIDNYEYSLDGGSSWTALNPVDTTSPVTITGLTNGTTTSIQLRAVSAVGPGASATVVAVPGFVPAAPTGLSGTAGNGSASIAFTPGAEGTRPIDNYEYSLDGGNTWTARSPDDTTSPLTVSGLTNGTAYSIRLRAVSAVGPGAPSTAVSVTPVGPRPPRPPRPIPTPTPTPTPVPVPPLRPGGSAVTVDGQPQQVTTGPNAQGNAVDISGEGFAMQMQGLDGEGKPLALGPGGALMLQADRGVRTAGSGFQGASPVDFYLDPPSLVTSRGARSEAAITLGSATTDANGAFTATVSLPRDVEVGDHVLQIVGATPTGAVRAVSVGVRVEPDASITLVKGARTDAGVHDRIRATGTVSGVPAGTMLTPYVRLQGRSTFVAGAARIVVQADGSFRWSRLVRSDRGVTAYVAWTDVTSNELTWLKLG